MYLPPLVLMKTYLTGDSSLHQQLLNYLLATHTSSLFDYAKYLWSTFATVGSVFLILYGISLDAYVLPTPVAATYFLFFMVMSILFYLEGLMIAIVETQYWDKETWKQCYPRAYMTHEIMNRTHSLTHSLAHSLTHSLTHSGPDHVKRFIIGRQFCTVLTGFILAQITTFYKWESTGYDPVLFYIVVKSGLIGVLTVLAFGQLMPELLAQEYPLRFMNMPGSYSVCCVSLFFDGVGVGHAAWAFYYFTRGMLLSPTHSPTHSLISIFHSLTCLFFRCFL